MFQKIILMITVTVLIGMLSIIAYSLNNITTAFASSTPNICPDYWKYDNNNRLCIIPKNGKNIGTLMTNTIDIQDLKIPGYNLDLGAIDFNNSEWKKMSGKTDICNKRDWANSLNIVWDGVTNVNHKCSIMQNK